MKKQVLSYSTIISAILFWGFSAAKAQDLTNTRWLCVGQLQTALSAEGIDSLIMEISSNSAFGYYCRINGQDTTFEGHWASTGPSSFNYIDSIFSSNSFQSVCPTTSVTSVGYAVSNDTLTMTSFHDTCQFITALFTGSQWVNKTLAVPNVPSANADVTIYPTPARDVVYIDTKAAFANSNEIFIITYDNTGRELNITTTSKGRSQLDVSKLPAGIYLLQLRSDNGQVVTKRFVVDR